MRPTSWVRFDTGATRREGVTVVIAHTSRTLSLSSASAPLPPLVRNEAGTANSETLVAQQQLGGGRGGTAWAGGPKLLAFLDVQRREM
jgi:hypothetical protein